MEILQPRFVVICTYHFKSGIHYTLQVDRYLMRKTEVLMTSPVLNGEMRRRRNPAKEKPKARPRGIPAALLFININFLRMLKNEYLLHGGRAKVSSSQIVKSLILFL